MNSRRGLSRLLTLPSVSLLGLVLVAVTFVTLPSSAGAEITTNVDDRVKVRFGWVRYDRHERVFKTWVKVSNISSAEILPPLRIAITEIRKNKYSLANADGIDSNGSSYVDIKLAAATLGVGESSEWTLLKFKKERKKPKYKAHKHNTKHADDDAWEDDDDEHKSGHLRNLLKVLHHLSSHRRHPRQHWRHHRGPLKFDFEMQGGSQAATSQPTTFIGGVRVATGDINVLFRVNLLSNGTTAAPDVRLRNLTLGTETSMHDDGLNGDINAGDGIYVVNQVIDTNQLMLGDCLVYDSVITSPQGFEIDSADYFLCATEVPLVIGDSDTSPGNTIQFGGTPTVGNELLVVLQPGLTEMALQPVLKDTGAEIIGSSLLSGLYQVRFPNTLTPSQLSQAIARFAAVDGVINAGPNYIGVYTTTPSDAMYASQHALQLISSDNLAAGTPKHVWDANATGSGITVTVLDSGVDSSHPDLIGKVVAPIFPGANIDTLGHGTEMAGIIAANTDNAIGVAAVARAANIESIKVSPDASVTQAEMIQGFNDAASPASAGQVVNAAFSIFGPLVANAGMCGAIDNLISGGAIVVNSAGDDNNSATGVWPGFCNNPAVDGLLNAQQPGDVISTANKVHFIVVGGSNCSAGACAADAKTATSNFGSWVDIAAPGIGVETTTIATVDPTLYRTADGTSVATALVSGSAAVLKSCGVATNQVFNTLDLGALVTVTADFNRINLYNSLETENTAPTGVGLSNNLIDENVDTSGGALIGNLSTTDATACDAHSYTITGGADAARFSLGGADGSQLLLDDGVLDFETKSSYAVTITSTDFYGVSTAQAFTVNVNDIEPETLGSDTGLDPAGDSGGEGCCDISSVTVTSTPGDVTISIRFHPGYDPSLISTTVNIDTDQDVTTGQPGVAAGGTIDAAQIGGDYIAFRAGRDGAATTPINMFVGPPINTFTNVGTAPVTYVADGYDIVIPLSLLGGDDGFLDVKVISAKKLSADGNTGILDIAPNEGLAPLSINP